MLVRSAVSCSSCSQGFSDLTGRSCGRFGLVRVSLLCFRMASNAACDLRGLAMRLLPRQLCVFGSTHHMRMKDKRGASHSPPICVFLSPTTSLTYLLWTCGSGHLALDTFYSDRQSRLIHSTLALRTQFNIDPSCSAYINLHNLCFVDISTNYPLFWAWVNGLNICFQHVSAPFVSTPGTRYHSTLTVVHN